MSLERTARGFNRLAPRYDALVWTFLGPTLQQSSVHFFDALPHDARLLVVGGGTGTFFDALAELRPNTKVLFVDLSEQMIALAQKRLREMPSGNRPQATFFHCSWDEIPPGLRADAVLTPFFLDCFSDAAQPAILAKLDGHLVAGGQWLFSDFNIPASGPAKRNAKLLLRLLYWGFNRICGLRVQQLPDFNSHFKAAGYTIREEVTFRNGSVVARLYKRLT